jgi:hypothetical protein
MSDALNAYKLDTMYLHKLAYAAGNSMSWLAPTRHIRLPLLGSELADMTIAIPWKLRAHRGLVLQAIQAMDPSLNHIPNDKGFPMSPLGAATLPRYVARGAAMIATASARVAYRYLPVSKARVNSIRNSAPGSWLQIADENKASNGMFSEDVARKVVSSVRAGTATVVDMRRFHLILTIELILNAFRGLRATLSFDQGISIPT